MSTTRDIRRGGDRHVQEALARTWAGHDAVVDAAWMPRGVLDVDDALDHHRLRAR
jgi:hypothetical protein